MACMLSLLQDYYPGAEIYVVINTGLTKEVTESMQVISDHYGVRWILLHDIDKQWGHPSQKGMRQIAEQLSEVIK
jgi:ADP-heptose:LPS heptosyltransferase